MGAAWILQFPLEPTQALLGQRRGIVGLTSVDQLHKSACQQFGRTPVCVRLERMPVPIRQSQAVVKSLRQGA